MLRNLNELKGIIKVFKNTDYYTKILVESMMDLINLDFNYSLAIVILMSSFLFFIIVGGIYYKFGGNLFYRKEISELQNKLLLDLNYKNNENNTNNENDEDNENNKNNENNENNENTN